MRSPQDIGRPVYSPECRQDLPRLVEVAVAAVEPDLLGAADRALLDRTPEGFLMLEEAVLRTFQRVASHVVAGVLALLHRDRGWVDAVVRRALETGPGTWRHRGRRRTPVRYLGGAQLALRTPYLSQDLRGRRGRRRGVGRRRESGTGLYPVLEALGILHQATPALASEVARQTVRTDSFAEARQALAERGIDLDGKTVRRLALRVGRDALAEREARVEAAARGAVSSEEFAGRRLVISTDGGRLRLREGGRRGRRGKRGRRRYRTPWREPKLLTVYAIDDQGKRDRRMPVFYDGTMGDADAAFRILVAELLLRGAAKAQQIILTADGARWIWNRADELARALGLRPDQIVKVADFYHAVEHLGNLAELCVSWPEAKKVRWVRRMRRHLKAGNVDAVIEAGRNLCRGRNAKKIGVKVAYFADRRDLMRYDRFQREGIPLGSGAMESGVRRVVNLRLKGAAIFWRSENAERMLHLRSYLKAGRWDELMHHVLHRSPSALQAHRTLPDAA
jgi:hypothetical protein